MANTVMTPPGLDPKSEERDLEQLSTRREGNTRNDAPIWHETTLKEENVFSSLYASVRDALFPPKLPPLELESKPIAVVDRMAVKRDPVPTAIATVVNGLILLAVIFFAAKQVISPAKVAPTIVSLTVPIPPTPPIKLPPRATQAGGGGGQHDKLPVAKGTPPPPSPVQLAPPKAPPLNPPKIAVANTLDIQKDIKLASNVPTLGIPNGPAVAVGGLGTGKGGGLGNGSGNGLGDGSGGNTGGGVRRIGNGVSAPVPIYTVEPEFSEEARKSKTFGNVLVNLIVDANGRVTRVKVLRGPGMGLEEKAVEAVRQYRFKPATENGRPVAVELNYEVNFQIF